MEGHLKDIQSSNTKNIRGTVLTSTLGNPKQEVLQFANDRKIDTIVVGTRDLGKVERFFLGSFSKYIVAHATCPVIVVKTPTEVNFLDNIQSSIRQLFLC